MIRFSARVEDEGVVDPLFWVPVFGADGGGQLGFGVLAR